MRLAKGGLAWIAPPLLAACLALAAGTRWSPAYGLGAALALLSLGLTVFFRDPDRSVAEEIVSAADGRVHDVAPSTIVTFLNVHNVHVVRAPYAGEIHSVERIDGAHAPAFLDASDKNAGIRLVFDTAWGRLEVRLLVGLVARRAVSYVEPGDAVEKGERIGMIRLGSRVDVELPDGSNPLVDPGQPVRAAETTLASEPNNAPGGTP